MDEFIQLVECWARKRGIDKADSAKQMLKVTEAVGEVASEIVRSDIDALRDGISDVIVTLINLAMQNDMGLYECLACAYDEIKGRKGEIINGVFIKNEDL